MATCCERKAHSRIWPAYNVGRLDQLGRRLTSHASDKIAKGKSHRGLRTASYHRRTIESRGRARCQSYPGSEGALQSISHDGQERHSRLRFENISYAI